MLSRFLGWILRRGSFVFALSPLVLMLVSLMFFWPSVDRLFVSGSFKHVDRSEVLALFREPLPVYGQTLASIAARFSSLPWVKQVFVTRDFLDGVRVFVVEREAVLRWGDHDFIDRSGLPFHRRARDRGYGHLPYLLRRQDMPFYVVYGAYRHYKALLKGTPWVIDRLVYNDGQGWAMSLNHRVRLVLGREQPIAHLKRFVLHADQLPLDDFARHYVVDARYQKGFSVLPLR